MPADNESLNSRPDPRLHPWRADLAADYLREQIKVPHYVAARDRMVIAGVANLYQKPAADSMMVSQLLHGEPVRVYEEKKDWAWCQSAVDNYVGYVRLADLGAPVPVDGYICVPRSFVYQKQDIKSPPVMALPMGAWVRFLHPADGDNKGGDNESDDGDDDKGDSRNDDKGEGRGDFVPVACACGQKGWMIARHLQQTTNPSARSAGVPPIGRSADSARLADSAHAMGHTKDFVALAEQFIGAPYLWGGRTMLGVDCSGLVQLVLQQTGRDCPRDTDMQEAMPGQAVSLSALDNAKVQRGDLIFWKGHVGILTAPNRLLHASATYMQVVCEDFQQAQERIARTDGPITSILRLPSD